uniref:Uncharacterized protein n=1 Tax=Anguilla anguilla TaxID=7936 RepID=A0A0E9SEY6_ANGAN
MRNETPIDRFNVVCEKTGSPYHQDVALQEQQYSIQTRVSVTCIIPHVRQKRKFKCLVNDFFP